MNLENESISADMVYDGKLVICPSDWPGRPSVDGGLCVKNEC